MTTARTYSLKTLGCKANLYDTQLIEAELQRRGWRPAGPGDRPELAFVNSCTVTDEADRQSRKTASRAARESPGTKVVMTGCGAEVDPQGMATTKGVSFVVGNQDKDRIVELVLKAAGEPGESGLEEKGIVLGGVRNYGEIHSRHPMDREWNEPESSFFLPPVQLAGDTDRTRSFIKIQEGCNSFCTYCIIPYGRGPSRSLPVARVVEQVNDLVRDGAREVIVTGTNIGDYGTDAGPSASAPGEPQLEALVRALLERTAISRIRLSTIDKVVITPELRGLVAENPRVCPHFHVSLQSIHSKVLKLMKRKYAFEDARECLNAIAGLPAPEGGVYVGMDVITGFPGETDEIFRWSKEQLEALPWTRLHVFPYSEREGTPATRLPNEVRPEVRAERARELRDLSLRRLKQHHEAVLAKSKETGRGLDRVLLESVTRGPDPSRVWVAGYSSNYLRVFVPFASEKEAQAARNRVVSVMPESVWVDLKQGDVAFLGRLG